MIIDPTKNERSYLNLLHNVMSSGRRRQNRTGTDTIGVFGPQIRFTLGEDAFPLFTTKLVHWKSIAHELLWMLSGSSRIDYLREHGVTIWDEWASAKYRPELGYVDGDLGPVYGVQWRRWQRFAGMREEEYTEYGFDPKMEPHFEVIDQIAQIVDKLRHRRDDRRILLSAWNVGEIERMKLPPCHYSAQFYVDEDLGLRCLVNIRSWDLFLGAPFNIAQYALLTHMLAHVSGLHPVELIVNAGDAHIYVNHLEQVREQLARTPMAPPRLQLPSEVQEIDDFRYEHCQIVDYRSHPAIKAPVAV